MTHIYLKRVSDSPDHTFGVFLGEDGCPICVALELPEYGNQKSISCIPTGTYWVGQYSSDRYKEAYEILNVAGRSKILIHTGNTVNDTEGCILPGLQFGNIDHDKAVLSSRDAFDRLKYMVGGEQFLLTIT